MANRRSITVSKMIITGAITAVVFLVIGICLGLFWFSGAAEPAERMIRTAKDWNNYFLIFYIIACVISFLLTLMAAMLGKNANMNKRGNWFAFLLVPIAIGLGLAAVLYVIAPNKNVTITVVSSIMMFIQGFGIFFVASLKAPVSWNYNPLG